MSIDSPSIPTPNPQPKKNNCLLWGCLGVVLLIFVTFCCLGSLIILPLVTDFDPLGIDLRNRIEEYIPWQDYIEDPSLIPDIDEFLEDSVDPYLEEDPGVDLPDPSSNIDASSIPLAYYSGSDFPANFQYPSGWDIEIEDYAVTFYDPNSFTYLYVGEDLVDEGTMPELIADDVMEALMEESQEGTFLLVSATPYQVPTGENAYLHQMEWTDPDGYFIWAYDLEIVTGESNIFFFLSGEDPEDIELYGDLLRIIVDSYSRQ